MKKLNNKGFTIVEGLLILVLAGLIVGAGWWVMKARSETNNSLDNTGNSQNIKPSTQATATDIDTSKYLDIKEMGVKIKLSDSTEDMYYKQTESDKVSGTSLTFYSKTLDGLKNSKGVSCKEEYIAFIIRLKPNDKNWSDPQTGGYYAEVNRKQAGDYLYGVTTKKQYLPECFIESQGVYSTASDKYDVIAKQFVEDFHTITND